MLRRPAGRLPRSCPPCRARLQPQEVRLSFSTAAPYPGSHAPSLENHPAVHPRWPVLSHRLNSSLPLPCLLHQARLPSPDAPPLAHSISARHQDPMALPSGAQPTRHPHGLASTRTALVTRLPAACRRLALWLSPRPRCLRPDRARQLHRSQPGLLVAAPSRLRRCLAPRSSCPPALFRRMALSPSTLAREALFPLQGPQAMAAQLPPCLAAQGDPKHPGRQRQAPPLPHSRRIAALPPAAALLLPVSHPVPAARHLWGWRDRLLAMVPAQAAAARAARTRAGLPERRTSGPPSLAAVHPPPAPGSARAGPAPHQVLSFLQHAVHVRALPALARHPPPVPSPRSRLDEARRPRHPAEWQHPPEQSRTAQQQSFPPAAWLSIDREERSRPAVRFLPARMAPGTPAGRVAAGAVPWLVRWGAPAPPLPTAEHDRPVSHRPVV
jgi:hypothetical protein